MSDLMALTIPYLCLSALPRGQYRSSAIAQLALRLLPYSTGGPRLTYPLGGYLLYVEFQPGT